CGSARRGCQVVNEGKELLPFGLGYHPNFRLPGIAAADIGSHELQATAAKLWDVDVDKVPTGKLLDIPEAIDFRRPRAIGATALDHVFTRGGGAEVAVLSH